MPFFASRMTSLTPLHDQGRADRTPPSPLRPSVNAEGEGETGSGSLKVVLSRSSGSWTAGRKEKSVEGAMEVDDGAASEGEAAAAVAEAARSQATLEGAGAEQGAQPAASHKWEVSVRFAAPQAALGLTCCTRSLRRVSRPSCSTATTRTWPMLHHQRPWMLSKLLRCALRHSIALPR